MEAFPQRDLTVFRIFKESLSNVMRHAQASRVEVSLRVAGEELVLDVLDDGTGITDGQLQDHGSFGLIWMRERVERVGGTVNLGRGPASGTRVRASVPLSPEK